MYTISITLENPSEKTFVVFEFEYDNFCVKLNGLDKFPIAYENTVPWNRPLVDNYID